MVKTSHIPISTVMTAVCDAKSFNILATVAHAEVDSQFLLLETRLSTKAFYSRMSRLLKAGIISKKNRKYVITSLGEVVFYCLDLIASALNNYWRLSALDSLSALDTLPKSEYIKTTKILLGNQRIGTILVQHLEQSQNDNSISLIVAPLST